MRIQQCVHFMCTLCALVCKDGCRS